MPGHTVGTKANRSTALTWQRGQPVPENNPDSNSGDSGPMGKQSAPARRRTNTQIIRATGNYARQPIWGKPHPCGRYRLRSNPAPRINMTGNSKAVAPNPSSSPTKRHIHPPGTQCPPLPIRLSNLPHSTRRPPPACYYPADVSSPPVCVSTQHAQSTVPNHHHLLHPVCHHPAIVTHPSIRASIQLSPAHPPNQYTP